MKITYKNIIASLKFITTTAFVVALIFKLYNIYKYGGPKKPDATIDVSGGGDDDDDDDDDDDMNDKYNGQYEPTEIEVDSKETYSE